MNCINVDLEDVASHKISEVPLWTCKSPTYNYYLASDKKATTVVKEGNLGHRQKCPRLPSLEPNCPPFALHGGQRGTILAKWGHITLLEGDLGQTSRTRKEGGGEAIFDSREGSIAPFCWIESRSFRLVLCGLRFFCSDFRLVQANGVVDLDFFTVILDLSRVDLDFFAGFVGKQVVNLYQFVVLIMRLTNQI